MFRPGEWPRLAAALLSSLLGGCAALSGMLADGEPIQVSEVRRLLSCNSDGPQARLSLLADREAVRAWQHGHNVDLIGVDPLPAAGAYVLVEMGVRMSAGYGVAVSRDARLDGGVVHLNASLFSPDPGQVTAQVVTSPCVLVALPPGGSVRAVELRDPAGNLLGRADAVAAVQ